MNLKNKIIDIHTHVSGKNFKNDLIKLKKISEENNIKKIFIMSTYFPDKKTGVSNYRLFSHIENEELFSMWCAIDFEFYFWMTYNEIEELLVFNIDKIVGIKIYSGYQNIDFKSKEFRLILELARKFNKPIMFHCGYLHKRFKSFNPMDLKNVFENNLDITFIIAHLANPFFQETSLLIKDFENVYSDISGLVDTKRGVEEEIKPYQELFKNLKIDKLLFGTDLPIQTFKQT